MSRKTWGIAASIVIAAVGSSAARPLGAPQTVSFAGRLADNGAPMTGAHAFTFTIFDAPTGGTAVWTESLSGVTVNDGLVAADLGSSVPLDPMILNGAKLFLDVQVDGTPMSPRVAINSVPYAIRADSAVQADSAAVSAKLGTLGPGDVVTSVTAGAGLTGGGTGGNLSVGAAFAGSGTASTVARSNHTHAGTYLPAGSKLSCAAPADKVTGIDPTTGNVSCGTDQNSGGTVTSVVGGAGLLGGTITGAGTLDVNFGATAGTVAAGDHAHSMRCGSRAADAAAGSVTVSVSCATGESMISGGCYAPGGSMVDSYPYFVCPNPPFCFFCNPTTTRCSANSWHCSATTTATSVRAYAICCDAPVR